MVQNLESSNQKLASVGSRRPHSATSGERTGRILKGVRNGATQTPGIDSHLPLSVSACIPGEIFGLTMTSVKSTRARHRHVSIARHHIGGRFPTQKSDKRNEALHTSQTSPQEMCCPWSSQTQCGRRQTPRRLRTCTIPDAFSGSKMDAVCHMLYVVKGLFPNESVYSEPSLPLHLHTDQCRRPVQLSRGQVLSLSLHDTRAMPLNSLLKLRCLPFTPFPVTSPGAVAPFTLLTSLPIHPSTLLN